MTVATPVAISPTAAMRTKVVKGETEGGQIYGCSRGSAEAVFSTTIPQLKIEVLVCGVAGDVLILYFSFFDLLYQSFVLLIYI